jgi:NAD(P)H-dependent FMN reductase
MTGILNIPVVLGSVRRDRQSPKIAHWLHRLLEADHRIRSQLVDLEELAIPIMEERRRLLDDPPPGVVQLGDAVAAGDGVVIVTPEYNNGYPGVLKNALDYLLPEFKRKPVGIVTVSAGGFGGVNCLAQLRLVLLAMGAAPIPASLPVSRVNQTFSDDGPTDPDFAGRAGRFLDEMVWWTEAVVHQRATDD